MSKTDQYEYFWISRVVFDGHYSGHWLGHQDDHPFAGKVFCVCTDPRSELEVELSPLHVFSKGYVWKSEVPFKANLPFLLTTDPTVERLHHVKGTFRPAEKWKADLEKFKRVERPVGVPGGMAYFIWRPKWFSKGFSGEMYATQKFTKSRDTAPIPIWHDKQDVLGWLEF